MRNADLFLLVLLVHFITLVSCEGQIRLTGWTERNGGRLEVFLNGKWGTVSGQTDPRDDDLHLGFGKTVCYQINHYNGDDTSIFTGTVSSLNKYLQKMPGNALIKPNTSLNKIMNDLNCTNTAGQIPRHILRCSYTTSRGNSGNDLAVLCPQNATNYDNPRPGQFALANQDRFNISQGEVYVYTESSWLPVSIIKLNEGIEILCTELGYTHATDVSTSYSSFYVTHYVNLPSISCHSHDVCLLQCFNKTDAQQILNNSVAIQHGSPNEVSITCEFDVHRRNSAHSPYIGDDCKAPNADGTDTTTIIIAITVSIAIVFIIVIIATTLVCYFNKNCFLYQRRKRVAYADI